MQLFLAEFEQKLIGSGAPKRTAYKGAYREGVVWNIWCRSGQFSSSLNRRQVGGSAVTGRLGRSIGSKHAETTRDDVGKRGDDAWGSVEGRGEAGTAYGHSTMIGRRWPVGRVGASRGKSGVHVA
jgi:hypothetical protein